uniref:Uncharacterized protein n=1 Tax=Arundo donax TaxID=35708 RepID=A0A0A8YBE8_ARUDO
MVCSLVGMTMDENQ